MPISHFVRTPDPRETDAQILRRGCCPKCSRPVKREHDMDGCAGTVSVCLNERCGWNDYDEQQSEHLRSLGSDPDYSIE